VRRIFILCLFCSMAPHASFADFLDADDAVNLRCLRAAYPEINTLEKSADGSQWLVFADGRRVLYSEPRVSHERGEDDPFSVDVRASMADIYPLEPYRPPTPPGVSPGRRRSYALLAALYGKDCRDVSRGLCTVLLLGRSVRLACAAAQALEKVGPALAAAARDTPSLAALLNPSGGFMWRNIAGEKRLSPHAFGIALDLSPNFAPYWRWCKQNQHAIVTPHSLQQKYPVAIVEAFEARGFIWGGKWHEYDIMHFEYRPELVCKARVRRWSLPEELPGLDNAGNIE
jgi:hypothetical protein